MVRGMVVLAVVTVVAVSLCGCGPGEGKAARRVRLPATLAADVPLPEGALLRSARDLGSKGLTLVFEANEPVATVAGRMRSRLEAGGWTLLSEVVVGEAVFVSYRQRARSVALGISGAGGVTVVGLAYQAPPIKREGVQG